MTTRCCMVLALVGLLTIPVVSARAEGESPEALQAAARRAGSVNGRCPVMGRLVTPEGGSATYQGETIAFCCPPCAKRFAADPARYMDRMRLDPAKYGYASRLPDLAAMRAAKAATGAANGRCPVMGRVVTPTGGSVTHGDQRIAFCCPPCAAKFRHDPERYLRILRADPLAYLYDRPGPTGAELRRAREAAGSVNGLCPVMKRKVTVGGGSFVHRGEKIGFCCPGCDARFRANPEAYLAAMRKEPSVYGYVPGER